MLPSNFKVGLAMCAIALGTLFVVTPDRVKSCSIPGDCHISTNMSCTGNAGEVLNWSATCGGDCDPCKFEIWMYCFAGCPCSPNPRKLGEVKWAGNGSYQFTQVGAPECRHLEVRLLNCAGQELHNMHLMRCGDCPCEG